MKPDRRKFLQTAAGAAALSSLGGCPLVRDPDPECPFGSDFYDPDSPLAIDVHAHVFNATDLQVKNFVRLVGARQSGGMGKVAELLAGALQKFAWKTAPTVDDELIKLAELKPTIQDCDRDAVTSQLTAIRDEKFIEGRTEIDAAARDRMVELAVEPTELLGPVESFTPESMALRQILTLPEDYESFFKAPEPTDPLLEDFPEAIAIASALKFVFEMLQYRYASVYNYLNTYNQANGIKIDLMLPALVDYDWWLSKGAATKSTLPKQMALMKEIAVLTGGRVHMLVAYDPFRQVVADSGGDSGFSPIQMVEKSVNDFGAMGVKLYPPMGFAPFGNETVENEDPAFWDRPWLAEMAAAPGFGRKLDAAMGKLYDFCGDNGVPIMGHSNLSNGPADEFEALTGPDYWRKAASEFDDTLLSFGHFGGAGSASSDADPPVQGFLELLGEDEAAATSRLAADASYFSNIIDDPDRLRQALTAIFTFGDERPAVNRLMYGADWKMLVAESGSEKYLKDFGETIGDIETALGIDGLSNKFFGENAASFLGLKKNQPNRQRLDRFYDQESLDETPAWMEKVDALG